MEAELRVDERVGMSENSCSSLREIVMTVREMDDSQLVGATVTSADELASTRGGACVVDVEVRSCEAGVASILSTSALEHVHGKRKRGRPPRGQSNPDLQPRVKTEEEDVCFICFDGGSLVLCDRRGCPKAYHPACIKRDEAFFRSKAKWNCGWHICSICQKASSYMCYTCTYSLCKSCTRNADYVAVRGSKGFCGTCMRTVCLIENVGSTNVENIQVDFDDKTSWEYLFKVYWICLKKQLSLTLDELLKAQNPWKGDDLPKVKRQWNGAHSVAANGVIADQFHGSNFRKNVKSNSNMLVVNEQNHVNLESVATEKMTSFPQGVAWATKELMDFVTIMRNGDVSVMSQFDVQALLLDYIKRNNLRDPRQKSHIICDSRLINLFGKGRVGHFEMLKLLEYHFLAKENTTFVETVRDGVGDAVNSHLGAAETQARALKNNKRRKSFRKPSEEGIQTNANSDDFAAIDVHNISLLYLKRNLMEILLDDADNFPGKVVGSFVRIKISGGDQKFDAYRLVRVVGTNKVAEPYKVGSRTTAFMIEILNLDKKEIISIDGISNQDFSEDECRRLRQSIKCGLVKRLMVGEILDKAMILQEVKVNDMLEMEVLKLNHLRDRASEKGQRKQLRECIEKLEFLSSPKERQRRLLEIPKVHTDRKMNPNYISDDDLREIDGKKQAGRGRPKTAYRGKGCQANHMVRVGNVVDENGSRAVPNSQKFSMAINDHAINKQVGHGSSKSEVLFRPVSAIIPSNLPVQGDQVFHSGSETDKLWHYQDPTGKVQGPFSMMQLRKWSSNGLFPLDLRVWRTDELQNDSVLLTDALVGRFVKELPFLQEVFSSSTNEDKKWESGFNLNYTIETASADSRNVESTMKYIRDKTSSELMSTLFGSDSPSWTTSVAVSPLENGQVQSSVQGREVPKCNKLTADQSHVSGKSSSPPCSKLSETSSPQASKIDDAEKLNTDLGILCHKYAAVGCRPNIAPELEEKRDESEVYSSYSPGKTWGTAALNGTSSGGWTSNTVIISGKRVEKLNPNQVVELPDIGGQISHDNESRLRLHLDSIKTQVAQLPVMNSGISWSTSSSLVVDQTQLPDVDGEWCGYSPTTKQSINHAATPASGGIQLSRSVETQLTIDTVAWQPIVSEGPDNDFSLVDESVSDLLAEVEAMESLNGIPSPMSRLTCVGDLTHVPDNDCFTPVEEFSPLPDHGKNDALSSTGEVRFAPQLSLHPLQLSLSNLASRASINEASTSSGLLSMSLETTISEKAGISLSRCQNNHTNDPIELPLTNFLDPHKRSSGGSSDSVDVDKVSKSRGISVNEWETSIDGQPLSSSLLDHNKGLDNRRMLSNSPLDANIGSIKESSTVNRATLVDRYNTNSCVDQGTLQNQVGMATASSTSSAFSWGNQQKFSGDRSDMRDPRGYQGRDSGFARDSRPSLSRPPFLGLGNGSHSFRPPPKGQRVCKYYESGYCRKGASCTYWHPGP